MQIKIDVDENDVMTANEVMQKIADAQDWDVVVWPDFYAGNIYRIVTKDDKKREGGYDVVNDEIEWDDGEYGSLFSDYDGNKDYSGENLMQFLDVTTAIWATKGDTEVDEETVLYTEC